ncbi:MAG TPA: hypothetical protein VK956_08525 [Verrucomicrobium sp.]|nr:hypothetical protein [Verrucomicrobium sp.]
MQLTFTLRYRPGWDSQTTAVISTLHGPLSLFPYPLTLSPPNNKTGALPLRSQI